MEEVREERVETKVNVVYKAMQKIRRHEVRKANWEWAYGPERIFEPEVLEGRTRKERRGMHERQQFDTADETEKKGSQIPSKVMRLTAPASASRRFQMRRRESQETRKRQGQRRLELAGVRRAT